MALLLVSNNSEERISSRVNASLYIASYFSMCVSLLSVVTVEFDPVSYTVSESDSFVNITVVKRGQTTQTVSVDFSTADGSATGKKQLWSA